MAQETLFERTATPALSGLAKLAGLAKFRWSAILVAFGVFVFFWFWLLPYHNISGDDLILHLKI